MDLEEFARLQARLAERAPDEAAFIEHLVSPCRGLLGGCPVCVALYRAVIGDERPTCMACLGMHFAYEPHVAADNTGPVELGIVVESSGA